MLASAACRRRGRVGALRDVTGGLGLRFATIAVDQSSGGAWRQPDIGPVLEGVAGLHRGMEDASRDELVPSGCARGAPSTSRRNQFRDHTPVGGDGNPLAGFNAANVSAQVVPQLANAGVHGQIIATYGHIWQLHAVTSASFVSLHQCIAILTSIRSRTSSARKPSIPDVTRRTRRSLAPRTHRRVPLGTPDFPQVSTR
jgi:hypothetical protein